ncbi:MAG TPA: ADOP family duplicated permease [Vicinamibacterales bacterium]|nr:ADOP family duplicated permease [Vicinamibacterales bacterium]
MSARQTWWLRVLLVIAADRDARADVLDALADEYPQRLAVGGASAAARWYRGQLLRSLAPLLARRMAQALRRSPFDGAWRDLRFACRSVATTPAFSLAIVLMLGVGIGAHSVVYAVYDGIMLRPLPYGERSARLITLHAVHPALAPHWDDSDMSYPDVLDVRQMTGTLEAVEAATGRNVSVSVGRETQRVLAASVTPGLFDMMGIAPAMGRTFHDNEGAAAGFESVAIISHALWQSICQGRADVIGQTVALNGRQVTVIGVMPRGFSFPDEHQMWLPYRGDPAAGRRNRGFITFGLMRSDATLDTTRGDLKRVADQLALQHSDSNRAWTIQAIPLRESYVSNGRNEATLLAAVSLLLLVACANVVGLLIARGLARQRELAVRAAMGAGRARLVRLLVLEVLLMALAGGALGLLLAASGIDALVNWSPEQPPYWATPRFDLRLVGFAAGLTALVGLVAGGIPALRISASAPPAGLLSGARSASDAPAHRRLQRGLVVIQVAVGFALLVGAGLLVRSGQALVTADGGFDPDPLLSLRVYIAGDRYDPIEARANVVSEIVRRVSALPGVEAVGATSSIPTDDGGADVRLLPPSGDADSAAELGASAMSVTPAFWDALALSLVEGRGFTATEAADPQGDAVIVNRTLAKRLWPGTSALDQTFRLVTPTTTATVRVVGVAPDLVYEEFSEQTPQSQLNVYVPYVRTGARAQALLVRVRPGAAVMPLIREEIRAIDPGLAVFDVMTMRERRGYNHWGDVFIGRTFSAFAVATLLLACIGAYGIAAFNVTYRRREIGVRLAVGATQGDVLRLFLSGALQLAAIGAAVGIPLALLTARALEASLFRVTPWEASIWLAPPLALMAVVLLASYLPARRASRVDPVTVLRTD